MRIEKWYPRFWAVYDDDGELVCVTVYKKGAQEVVRRITDVPPENKNMNRDCET